MYAGRVASDEITKTPDIFMYHHRIISIDSDKKL